MEVPVLTARPRPRSNRRPSFKQSYKHKCCMQIRHDSVLRIYQAALREIGTKDEVQ